MSIMMLITMVLCFALTVSVAVSIGRAAISYSACSISMPRLAWTLGPSTLNCSWRWAIFTCNAVSMVRRCSSMAPHKCPSRVLLGGLKVWRRIKLIIR